MLSATENYTDNQLKLQKILADMIVAEGLPVGVMRAEADSAMSLVIGEDQKVEDLDDYVRDLGYVGKSVYELPISELGYLIDFGSREASVIDDIRG